MMRLFAMAKKSNDIMNKPTLLTDEVISLFQKIESPLVSPPTLKLRRTTTRRSLVPTYAEASAGKRRLAFFKGGDTLIR